jgi:hypothetical protein
LLLLLSLLPPPLLLLQIMRFDVKALPGDQMAQPFDLTQQMKLYKALAAEWADTKKPLGTPANAPRQVILMQCI